MSETQADGTTPTLEVRVLRDGVVVHRELCEGEADARVVVQTWSDVEGVVVDVVDLTRDAEPSGVLEPRHWEVDADDASDQSTAFGEEEER
jgi:hypothetical protein